MYRVFDDKFANSTTVVIQILDVNDNPSKFDKVIYNVHDVNEEEPGISKISPQYLLTLSSDEFLYRTSSAKSCFVYKSI